ncbi:conjugal transfer protein TraI [Sphingobacterium sp. MYb388]|uniref:conjugal transfer protein TraI n=1 Tax=Sphingobacterium sp. MYb388 TaxID=2745437 RepID=UPI0030AC2E18
MNWRKMGFMVMLCAGMLALPTNNAHAGILDIIKAAVVKAIKAADLAIQRQQNKVIWLQNAQKVLENTLSKLKLDEIADWTEKQRAQYGKYFEELQKVKTLISYYQRVKDISVKQSALVKEYGRVWQLVSSDKHFTTKEKEYMGKVYTGILQETLKNIDRISIVVSSFKTQMTDAKRLEIINEVADNVDENYADLKTFNSENVMLRLQRAKSESEISMVKKLYGLQ